MTRMNEVCDDGGRRRNLDDDVADEAPMRDQLRHRHLLLLLQVLDATLLRLFGDLDVDVGVVVDVDQV